MKVVALLFLLAQGPPQAPVPPQAPPVADYRVYVPSLENYATARGRAVREGKPCIVFVNCSPSDSQCCDWAVNCWINSIFEDSTPRIVVSKVIGGDLRYVCDLPADATARDIHDAVYPPPVKYRPVQSHFPEHFQSMAFPVFQGGGRSC